MKLRIATLNSWSGLNYHGLVRMGVFESKARRDQRFEGLVQVINQSEFDVLVLNELNLAEFRLSKLLYETGLEACYHVGVAGVKLGRWGVPVNLQEADVILARPGFNLSYEGRVRLGGVGFAGTHCSFHLSDLTQAILATIEVDGVSVYICGTHLHASPQNNYANLCQLQSLSTQWNFPLNQAKKTTRRISRECATRSREVTRLLHFLWKRVPADSPLILMGDFNAAPHWPEIEAIIEDGFLDWQGEAGMGDLPTWDPTKNQNLIDYYLPETKKRQNNLYDQMHALDEMDPRRIDYIFTKNIGSEQIKRGGIAFNQGKELSSGVEISDHFGVFAEIDL